MILAFAATSLALLSRLWAMDGNLLPKDKTTAFTIFTTHFTKFVSSNLRLFLVASLPKIGYTKKTGHARVSARTVPDHKSTFQRKVTYG